MYCVYFSINLSVPLTNTFTHPQNVNKSTHWQYFNGDCTSIKISKTPKFEIGKCISFVDDLHICYDRLFDGPPLARF